MPWLALLAEAIRKHASADKPTVFACSALKRKYRDVLAAKAASGSPAHVLFVSCQHRVSIRRPRGPGHCKQDRAFSLQMCCMHVQVVLLPPYDVLRARLEARWNTGQLCCLR